MVVVMETSTTELFDLTANFKFVSHVNKLKVGLIIN